MHRNILRRETLLNDPLHLVVSYRRQRRVVAVEERQPNVLIPHKQRRPRVLWIPFAKAKDALVGALPRNDLLELESEVLAFKSVEFDLQRLAFRLADVEYQVRLARCLKPEIQIVTHRPSIHLHNAIAGNK